MPSTGAPILGYGLYERDEQTGRIYPILEDDEDPELLSLEQACFPEEFDLPTGVEADQFNEVLSYGIR